MELYSIFIPVKAENERANLLQNLTEYMFCPLENEDFITDCLKLKLFVEDTVFFHWSKDRSGKERLPTELIPHNCIWVTDTLLWWVYFAPFPL